MKFTPKLIGLLNRVFDKDPKAFVALRVRYAGGLTWRVADGVLDLTVTGGVGASASFTLEDYSLRTLVDAIASRAGFEVAFLDGDRAGLSAMVLLDGDGDQDASNGDAILGYTSLLWAFFEAFAAQLQHLRETMVMLPLQMATTTAEGMWLDELGSYYGVVREIGEVDAIYGQRIIAQTLRPIANNVAMESAIELYTAQPCTVVDVTIYRGVFPIYDGTIHHDGAYDYDTVGLPEYGLFDVVVAYDLIAGGDVTTFLATVQAIVEKLRASGTHLRAIALSSAAPMTDAFGPPSDLATIWDSAMAISDAFTAPAEAVTPWSSVATDLSDAFTAPTETTVGAVNGSIDDGAGGVVVDENGDPILLPLEPLFL